LFRSASTRRSFTVAKTKQDLDTRRSCATTLPVRKRRSIYEWESTTSPSFLTRKSPAPSAKKSHDLSVHVRKSLFLKSKGDVSFNNSVALERSSRKSSVLNVDGSFSSSKMSAPDESLEETPSPRGVKRGRESSAGTASRISKRRKHEEVGVEIFTFFNKLICFFFFNS
jgi:hypothetical protein